jgi:hypothetical protein
MYHRVDAIRPDDILRVLVNQLIHHTDPVLAQFSFQVLLPHHITAQCRGMLRQISPQHPR